jgi:gamma-glutamyl:cysteine ligase YbdK (ATP-grasp superfamily)
LAGSGYRSMITGGVEVGPIGTQPVDAAPAADLRGAGALRHLVRENKWRAARYGLDAEIIVDRAGATQAVRHAIVDLVDDLVPTARRLHCVDEMELIPKVLERGASYHRQRAVAAAHGGQLEPVVDPLLTEMKDGLNL